MEQLGWYDGNRGEWGFVLDSEAGSEEMWKLNSHSQVTQLPHLLLVLTPQLVWNCNNLPTKYSHSSPRAQNTRLLLLRGTSPERRAAGGQIEVRPS